MNSRKDVGKGRVRDFLAIHANAFVDSFEMRRSVESGAVTGVTKNRFEKCGGRAFAVGTRDMGGRIFLLGVPETLCEDGDVFEIEFRRRSLRWRSELSPEREQIADRFLEVHFNSSAGRARMR